MTDLFSAIPAGVRDALNNLNRAYEALFQAVGRNEHERMVELDIAATEAEERLSYAVQKAVWGRKLPLG